MNYIITESKLSNALFDYIQKYFSNDDLDWEFDSSDDNIGYDKNIINFMGRDYIDGVMDDYYFTYIKKEYYVGLENNYDLVWKWIDKAPLLDLSPGVYWVRKMDSLFSTAWRPVFEKWFSVTYPDFPVKTFVYPRNN